MLSALVDDYLRVRAAFRECHGRLPNIFRARTFSEKIQRRKLFERDPRMPSRADKILVKDFVREKLGDGWTTPTLWFGSELPPPAERTWPVPFVVKASHGSAMNRFVRSPAELDWAELEAICREWTDQQYGGWGAEWLYREIAPRLLIEPFIGETSSLPIDYKLWTFGGRVEFIQVDTDRGTSQQRAMFNRAWERLPFGLAKPIDPRDIPCPKSLAAMIEAAEILSEDFAFVRVDFYEIKASPLFGEITYYPGSGVERFDPPEYDRNVGNLWR
jgi:TupA-like ATPgrasp